MAGGREIREEGREGWQGEPRDDLTLGEVGHALSERWVVVAVCALVAVGVFLISAAFRGPSFTAEAQVEVRPAGEDAAATGGFEAVSSSLEDPTLLDGLDRRAAEETGWAGSVRSFSDSLERDLVEADGRSGTRSVEVRFTSSSPEVAARAANAYARAYVERLEELDGQLAGGTVSVVGEVVREAQAPAGSFVAGVAVGAALATGGGLLFGGVAALFLEGRARRWSGSRDAELTLRVPVLGVIPDHSSAGYNPTRQASEAATPLGTRSP